MDARFALAHSTNEAAWPELRRYAGRIEAVAAFLGAVVAGLLLLAPLDLGRTASGPILQLDLLVVNMPRAAAAGAVFAVVSAGLSVALGRRAAWIASLGSAAVLLVGHLFDRAEATAGTLTTVNYIDAIFSGILLGALAIAVLGRPPAMTAYLIGALASVLVGDLTALPAPGSANRPFIEWASSDTPPVWFVALAVIALIAATAAQVQEPAPEDDNTDLPIGPIVAALLLVTTTAVTTEWFVRHAENTVNLGVAVGVTIAGALLAAFLLPGRDGALVLLAVPLTAAGSAIIAVPRPDWTAPLPLIAVAAGYYLGRRLPVPWLGLAGCAALSVFAALTAPLGHRHELVPIIGITVLGLLYGFCFAAALPSEAIGVVVALSVLLVPGLVIALRGHSLGRVAYSAHWYRDPNGLVTAGAGWLALAVTVGCAAALSILYRFRTTTAATFFATVSANRRHLSKRSFTHSSASE
ncbi:hypothetical protein [Nocardia huaxiensis]|uniref:Uncharacterized protein n=1 Tax=Nocardia huaxiensis TaxID=2755382 RepID=A0A7D6ZKX4_9NOCA|nr:hypothetical protein [Nocardia huaxiensis]QLY32120.1 hypothetical protein H0264_07500 [Nocardia huaxiensis]UFS95701.1 hypothetical protein LPY97_34375 [Nocardia huaxiensis]